MLSEYEKQRLEAELKVFTARNFVRPGSCRNLDQIRFYVAELCRKIEEYQVQFNYVPQSAYVMLAQYNSAQNKLLHQEFSRTYS